MSLVKRTVSVLTVAGFVVILLTPDAYAYIDPATGSYILQILLAGLLGALFTVKVFWRNIKSVFARLLTRNTQDDGKAE